MLVQDETVSCEGREETLGFVSVAGSPAGRADVEDRGSRSHRHRKQRGGGPGGK